MKLGDVITLLKAGYTKADIQELRAAETAPAEPEAVNPVSSATAAPEEAPAPTTPEPAPAADAHAEEIAELRRLVDNLTKLVQHQNILNSSMPAPKSQEQTAEDILATIINPKKEDK